MKVTTAATDWQEAVLFFFSPSHRQTEWRGFERHVFPGGWHPGSSHPAAQRLPSLHTHDPLRRHPPGGRRALCAAAGDAEHGAPGCGTSPVS